MCSHRSGDFVYRMVGIHCDFNTPQNTSKNVFRINVINAQSTFPHTGNKGI